jgi:DNA-binding NtrC family response regulator
MSALQTRPFAEYKFLIIEDEIMQAWSVGDMLVQMGGTIDQIALSYEQGWNALSWTNCDCAIVDIDLNGKLAFPLVAVLERDGIPFIYCSAYADALDVYPEVATAPRVSKPVTIERLRDAVLLVLRPRQL